MYIQRCNVSIEFGLIKYPRVSLCFSFARKIPPLDTGPVVHPHETDGTIWDSCYLTT